MGTAKKYNNPKQQMQWLLRGLLVVNTRRLSAGFVLPTAMVVLLVVVLLTTAMMLRSFDRSRNASNVRASQAAIKAATPAIARARVKIEELLKDPILPKETPSELTLYNAIKTNPKYTFGDENRLKLAFDINKDNIIETNNTNIDNDETLTTAWRFPVDTDNNGKFDSYTLYGIYFRNPSTTTVEARGNFNRARNPLEARITPIATGAGGSRCANLLNTNSNLDDSGWQKSGDELKKSFFVYTVTVPITDNTGLGAEFEKFPGNNSFFALEYQQDQSRIPLINYAAFFDGDLELTPNSDFRLNGKVHTNGNLLVGGRNNAEVRFYQVSGKNSCFYQVENGSITVGGNVANGNAADTSDQNSVDVDLFGEVPDRNNARIGSNNKSTETGGGALVAYNDDAFNQRIALMKREALSYCREESNYCSEFNPPRNSTVLAINRYPQEVKNRFSDRLKENPSLNTYNVLSEELELYFKNRTRRVPYAEIIGLNGNATGFYNENNVFPGFNIIEPPVEWREPTLDYTKLQLKTRQLEATSPDKLNEDGKQKYLGDRIVVGNNLPAYWKDGKDYITSPKDQQFIAGTNWTDPDNQPRYRSTQVQQLGDLNVSDRDAFWEEEAAAKASGSVANSGGLRIITGAGIYQHDGNLSSTIAALRVKSILPTLPSQLDSGEKLPKKAPQDLRLAGELVNEYTAKDLVWSDLMPMKGDADQPKDPPDLRMRATAVYDYRDTSYTDTNYINRTPTACISSYYDPTDSLTARNDAGLPDVSGDLTIRPLPAQPDEGVGSNNGVVYEPPYTNNNARFSAIATYLPELKAQAKMLFPNGRLVNEPLQKALIKLSSNGTLIDPNKPLSLSENSAIDTAICSLKILNKTITPQTNPVIPHGAIREASFLDAREVKALHQDEEKTSGVISLASQNQDSKTDYNLKLEQRQPLEIRVTEINLDTDRTRGITRKELIGTNNNNEYVLPNTGIIYASRDDALLDDSFELSQESDRTNTDTLNGESDLPTETKLLSPTDFILDSTRRPNGIRLINGSNLSRTNENTYREEEKGLTLVTNLPVYIKGDFNLHQTPSRNILEEFLEKLQFPDWSNFYTRNSDLNPNFACRPGKPGCPNNEGDTWRPATIISDAVTVLSSTFKDGFRNQGDYDLNNNQYVSDPQNPPAESITQKRKNIGLWDNSFVTSAAWSNTNSNGNPYPNQKTNDSYVSSYLTNGVTPVQRRTNFPEYLMEVCIKLPVSECTSDNWYVKPPQPGTPAGKKASEVIGEIFNLNDHPAGTTAQAAAPEYQRYARRVAFISTTTPPIPVGINDRGIVTRFPYGDPLLPRKVPNALWFKTTNNRTDPTQGESYSPNNPLFIKEMPTAATGQPLLVPVLQIHSPDGSPGDSLEPGNQNNYATNWLQTAGEDTTVNATFVSGNSPSRPQEESAGLPNFVRFLENWQDKALNIAGSFIQMKRSVYATAPFSTILRQTATASATTDENLSLFNYPINNYRINNGTTSGTVPYFTAPNRQWIFDVALLSQPTDLFAQKFTTPSKKSPNEFFREVGRDDPWVQTLLCAATASDRVGRSTATYTQYAVPDKQQRPASCRNDAPNYPANNSGNNTNVVGN